MKGYLIAGSIGGITGLAIGTLDGMADRSLAIGLGLAGLAIAFVVFSKWVDKR
jgi:hypothetical protein